MASVPTADPYRSALTTAISNYEKLLKQTDNPAAKLDLEAKIDSARKALTEKPTYQGTVAAAKEASKSDARGQATRAMRSRTNNTPRTPAMVDAPETNLRLGERPLRPTDLPGRDFTPEGRSPIPTGPSSPADKMTRTPAGPPRPPSPDMISGSGNAPVQKPSAGSLVADRARSVGSQAALRGAARVAAPLGVMQELQGTAANEGEEEYMAANPSKYPFARGGPQLAESAGLQLPPSKPEPRFPGNPGMDTSGAPAGGEAPPPVPPRPEPRFPGNPGMDMEGNPTPNPATVPQLKPSEGLMGRPEGDQVQPVELQPIVVERLRQVAQKDPQKLRQAQSALAQYRARMDAMERAITAALNNDQADTAAGMPPRL